MKNSAKKTSSSNGHGQSNLHKTVLLAHGNGKNDGPPAPGNGKPAPEKQPDAASQPALNWNETLPMAELEQIWARRAAQLAEVIEGEDQGERIELAVIRLGHETFGLDVHYVYEIRPLMQITRLPRTPDWVAGVVNLRGRIISVLDLRRYLNLPAANQDAAANSQYLVVVETAKMELAILVDDVLHIENLPVDQIQEATSAVRGIRPEYVRGVVVYQPGDAASEHATEERSSLLVILDLPVLLADPELIVHEEVV